MSIKRDDYENRTDYLQAKAADDCDNRKYEPPLNIVTEIIADDGDRAENHTYIAAYQNHKAQTR